VYAKWGNTEPTRYTITFNADGGTVTPASKQVNSGDPADDLPTPTKSDNTFGGWYTAQNGGGDVFTSATIVTASITVYAKWTATGGNNEKPVELSKTVQLTEANWKAILTEIETAGKYVNLNLSDCTRSNVDTGGGLRSDGTFDPIRIFEDGKEYIVSLILPNVATSIFGFFGFSSLTSVSASAATSIGDYAFEFCTSLTSVSFPAATTIAGGAFLYCTSLTSVSFPATTTIANNGAFWNCTSLAFFNLTGTGILSTIEGGKALVQNNTELIAYPSASGNITLNTITSIRWNAFSGCTSLTSVSFLAATDIGQNVFGGCTSLTNVEFPAATSIDAYAFASTGTTALTIILGPNAPITLDRSFNGIDSAKTVTVKVPSGATGYGTIPATYSGNDTTENWGNGFRGGGWNGSGFNPDVWGGASDVNSNITLIVEYQ
jgi:uncharacterized repeat protein (TIGR02543 family)